MNYNLEEDWKSIEEGLNSSLPEEPTRLDKLRLSAVFIRGQMSGAALAFDPTNQKEIYKRLTSLRDK